MSAATVDTADETQATPETAARTTRRRRSPMSVVSNLVLDLLALFGLVCVVLVVCAYVFHISLIMFKTGSMTPTIPTGSLAIVREVPASELRPGDVATVDRGDGQLPVTHRVVTSVPAGGDTYTVQLKGDSNDTQDPNPYVIDHARKVLWSTPGAGYLVARIQNPKVMAVTTMGMALLVTWAFWPRKRRLE